jgi:DNA-binding NarL/FixJ family response regulator
MHSRAGARLPVRLAPEDGAASRMVRRGGVCDDSLVTYTVLIVDDHEGFRERARALLEVEGFEVVGEAGDGAEGLALAAERRPDVLLLDIQLPDQAGFDVAYKLRSNGGGPSIVLTSTRDAADYGDLISACGACGFVPKGELSGEAVRALLE